MRLRKLPVLTICAATVLVLVFLAIYYPTPIVPHCEQLYFDANAKGDCYLNWALLNNDSRYCGYIPREACFRSCTVQTISECFFRFAVMGNDPLLCNDIPDYFRQICLLKLTGELGVCEEVENVKERDLCYGMNVQFAHGLSRRIESCERIYDNVTRDLCYVQIENGLDNVSDVEQVCAKMVNLDLKESCLRRISQKLS